VELILLQQNSSIQRHYYSVVQLTSREVAGSVPDVVIGIFHLLNPSSRTTALGSTQPVTSTRGISWDVMVARDTFLSRLSISSGSLLEH
jgi:hypothetical protein